MTSSKVLILLNAPFVGEKKRIVGQGSKSVFQDRCNGSLKVSLLWQHCKCEKEVSFFDRAGLVEKKCCQEWGDKRCRENKVRELRYRQHGNYQKLTNFYISNNQQTRMGEKERVRQRGRKSQRVMQRERERELYQNDHSC